MLGGDGIDFRGAVKPALDYLPQAHRRLPQAPGAQAAQVADRHEAIAAPGEVAEEVRHEGYRYLRARPGVVQTDNDSRLHLLNDSFADTLRRERRMPVPAFQAPVNGGKAAAAQGKERGKDIRAVRGAKQAGALPVDLRNRRRAALHVSGDSPRRPQKSVPVAKAVTADLVAAPRDVANDLRVGQRLLAQQEERRLRPGCVQRVQHLRRRLRVGAIVEGQSGLRPRARPAPQHAQIGPLPQDRRQDIIEHRGDNRYCRRCRDEGETAVHNSIVQQTAFWFLALFWAVAGLWHLWHLRRWRCLPVSARSLRPASPVAILLPARNEAGRILPECVHSLLAQEYKDFEIIAVNDCSTDETGDILRRHAAADSRLRVVEGTPPPDGWMGKPWALTQALAKAGSAEWLLLTDADVVMDPTLLGDAVGFAEYHELDALTLSPRHGTDDFWVRALLPAYEWIVTAGLPLVHRDGEGDEKASACGAFFLVRRAVLERIGGFAGVRDRAAEDVTLARRVKGNGYRLAYLRAKDRFWTPHYYNAAELTRGWSKNLWTPDFGVLPGLLLAVVLLGIGIGPLIGLLVGGGAGTVAFFTQLAAFVPGYADNKRGSGVWRGVFAPVALALAAALILSAIIGFVTGRGGTQWKGRALHISGDAKKERG